MTPPFTTRGRRSGPCRHVHLTLEEANACLEAHRAEVSAAGGTSDRKVVERRSAGRKPAGGVTREIQVLVRLAPDDAALLDSLRGDVPRPEWFRQLLHARRS